MNKLDWLWKLPDWGKTAVIFIVTLMGIIVGIVELIEYYQAEFMLLMTISGIVISFLIWYLCFHLYLTQDEVRIQRFALTGIFVVPLLFGLGLFLFPQARAAIRAKLSGNDDILAASFNNKRASLASSPGESVTVAQIELAATPAAATLAFAPATDDELLILIATFYLTKGTDDRDVHNEIRRAIQHQIEALKDTRLRVAVEPTALPAEVQAEAQALGEKYGARVVIWGSDTGVRITVNYLNLQEPGLVSISETERTQLANPSAYASFVTKDLPAQLTFLSLFAVGQSYYSEGQYDQAVATIEKAVEPLTPEMNPPEAISEAYFRLGWLYLAPRNDPLAAVAAYDRAIALKQDNPTYYYNRGTAYLRLPDYPAAIADYSQALSLDPKYTNAYYTRGNAHLAAGQPQRAIADYEQALALRPAYPKALNNLCWVGTLTGQVAEVLAACEQAVSLADETEKGGFQDSRGVARALSGDVAGAIEDFEAYLAWLKANKRYQPGGNGREAWLEQLKAGHNPFDAATLQALLKRE
jgi:tetratricopeptide (TPR) repeat protein